VGNRPLDATDPSGLEWDVNTIRQAIFTLDGKSGRFGTVVNYHLGISKGSAATPQVRAQGRYVDAVFPESWTNAQVLDAIFNNTSTWFNADILDHVSTAEKEHPMQAENDSSSSSDPFTLADEFQAAKRAGYRQAVQMSVKLIEQTFRASGGEGAYAAYRFSNGEGYEYIAETVTDAISEIRGFVDTIQKGDWQQRANATASLAMVVIVGKPRRGGGLKGGFDGSYKSAKAAYKLDNGFQWHHLNQEAIYGLRPVISGNRGSAIPYPDGVVVPVGGAALSLGSPHNILHVHTERFLDRCAKNQKIPTNGEYGQMVREALNEAGFPQKDIDHYCELARKQRIEYGHLDDMPIPRFPNPIPNLPGYTYPLPGN
jgi:hypothetical protein